MCDGVVEIDGFIEYELTKDCDSVEEETFIYEDEDGVEVEQLEDIIIKPESIIMEVIEEDDTEQGYEVAESLVEIEDEPLPANVELIKEEDIEEKPEVAHSPPNEAPKGPKRYLLFDELVANIVDYDVDETPIVEFSLSNTDTDEKLPVECGICPDVMHKSKLSAHLKTHLVPGTNRYACIYCDKSYKDHSYLAGHSRRHMGIRPYVCEPCKLYFSTKQDLRVHNQRRHQEKEHICEICGKTFSQNTMLKRHRESTHEKMRRFQCEHCPKAYYKNFSLQEHVRNVHMGNRRMLVCPFCGMQCRDAHKMARHRKLLHLNQKYFQCEICQEEFTDISYFDAHKRSIQCRNNTQRKLEEEQLLQQHAEEEQLLLEQQEEDDQLDEEIEQKQIHFVTHSQDQLELQTQADDLCYEITVVNSDN
ncbi:zinc finger and BTB domain-containing protein 24-like [Rhagoletis pomonella]|uniref:zinc finger and BTB domain-containing protein 24-like n=1 Tax=Rhagoletis pomonella TaxID=28610 RepID=UPI00177F7A21|nr:zinc finger and BTB domain-containing protein 24-like [Rhagoletis pomonella]